MKNLIVLISSMTLFIVCSTNINAKSSMQNTTVEDSIHVWTSPDLFDLATTWVSAYAKINPEAKINVSMVSANKVSSLTEESRNIGLITKDYLPNARSKKIWKMAVGRDIIVPVINSENPFKEEIFKRGISPEEFAGVFTDTGKPTWGALLNSEQSNPINFYSITNESNKPYLSEFLQTDQYKINGKEVTGIDEMLTEINKDKFALGFCRLVDVLDSEGNEIKEGISLIPMDINGNNKLDYFENIYDNPSALERGVWVGKYPKVLYSNIYAVAGNQPINSDELAFLKWVVTEGQQYLLNKGYSELILSERHSKVQGLYATQLPVIDVQKPAHRITSFLVLALIIFGAFITYILIKLVNYKSSDVEEEHVSLPKVFTESSVLVPNGMFFDKSHTWAFMERDGSVRIGIADFLQHVTGMITTVKMKNPGEFIKKGEPFLTLVQQGKQLNIDSPVSGKIKEINVQLKDNSSIINSSPYSDGWVYVVESVNWLKEIKNFFMAETYKIWLHSEITRLKHFFSSVIKLNVTNQLQEVIQDGGEMKDGPMESFGPEVWEEFQSIFINREK